MILQVNIGMGPRTKKRTQELLNNGPMNYIIDSTISVIDSLWNGHFCERPYEQGQFV
jgi:hypothetical protein